LTENEKTFWLVFVVSISSVVLVSLVMLRLFRRYRRRKEDQYGELKLIPGQKERFRGEMRLAIDHIQNEHRKRCEEFQKLLESVNVALRKEDMYLPGFLYVTDLVQTLKPIDRHCSSLHNQIKFLETKLSDEDKRLEYFEKQINAVREIMKKCGPSLRNRSYSLDIPLCSFHHCSQGREDRQEESFDQDPYDFGAPVKWQRREIEGWFSRQSEPEAR
jgi:hypothetical protein